MSLLYQVLAAAGLVLAAPFLLARRGRHYLTTVRGRLGLDLPGPPGPRPLWLHAVSVGEVGVAATLARALPPCLPLVVTTVTPTGQARAREAFGREPFAGRAAVAYLPFELAGAVRRFFRRFEPAGLVLVEGDYWPLVLAEARRRGLPVAVVNGRVGDRSFRRMRRLRRLLGPLFDPVRRFGVQTAADRDRLVELGVEPGRVEVCGNLKYDTPEPPERTELAALIRRLAAGRPVLVAGSTMGARGSGRSRRSDRTPSPKSVPSTAGASARDRDMDRPPARDARSSPEDAAPEELAVAGAFQDLGGGDRALLVVAPRHPERWDAAAAFLEAAGLTVVRRSEVADGAVEVAGGSAAAGAAASEPAIPIGAAESEGLAGPADALLLDTMGELAAVYRHAAAVFVGGTLVPTGGHNPLEAARFGVPVAAGPSMENFRQIADELDAAGAWRRVADACELGEVWSAWLDDPAEARRVGKAGRRLVEANRGAVDRAASMLHGALGDALQPSRPSPRGRPA